MNKGIYIKSIEASAIYNYNNREGNLKKEYVGMLPYSLETIKLQSLRGFKVNTKSNKHKTDDIINVKFNQSVKSADELIKLYNNKLKQEDITETQYEYYQQQLEAINNDWESLTRNELRHELYENGFTIGKTKYVFYKRSASKSRTGQALFINEKLFSPMKKWSHMGLKFDNGVDLPSLLAYESLVGSAIESTIEINPNNIFIISDVDSTFKEVCNVVNQDAEGNLQSIEQLTEVKNSLFDGQALLDAQYFDGKGMMLLRNHMFKSCAFNANVQQFLIDHCPTDNFDKWQLTDIFGNKMYAKDIHMITTPSSLKFLKFADDKKKMFDKWKKVVQKDGNLFGVIKNEKPSKIGHMTQQLSYQMLNSLPLTKQEVFDLAQHERKYIVELKNDTDTFVKYLDKNKSDMNSNEMIVELYKVNPQIFNVKEFKDFRADTIKKHIKFVKSGKVRVHGDYFVLVGNPIEMLFHSIGQFDGTSITLNGSSVSCKAFEYDKALVGFRNPHTSPSNVLRAYNEQHELIDTYMNMTDNIVTVNSIGTPILDILSGADFDSDSLLLTDNETIIKAAQRCTPYKPCINGVSGVKQSHELNNHSIAKIDCTLSKSQILIGRVVNFGQVAMSKYWNSKDNQCLEAVNIMTVLSTIAIDLAKKSFDTDIEQQIKLIEKKLKIKAKPHFFKVITNNFDLKTTNYNCPMQYLQVALSTPKADHNKTISFEDLLIKQSQRDTNLRQKKKILEAVSDMSLRLGSLHNVHNMTDDEKLNVGLNIVEHYQNIGFKMTCSPQTMYGILAQNEKTCFMRLLSMLYHTQKDTFLSSFVKNS